MAEDPAEEGEPGIPPGGQQNPQGPKQCPTSINSIQHLVHLVNLVQSLSVCFVQITNFSHSATLGMKGCTFIGSHALLFGFMHF